MTKTITFIFLLLSSLSLHAQQEDIQWLLGGSSEGVIMDFRNDSLQLRPFQKPDLSISTVSSICDENGELLFYSNGCYIADAQHEILENGDTLVPGTFFTSFCETGGSPLSQSTLALRDPGDTLGYYLFHYLFESVYTDTIIDTLIIAYYDTIFIQFASTQATGLAYAYLKKDINTGKPKVIERKLIHLDTFANGYLQAVRHANGKDWWLIAPRFLSNCYYTYLLRGDGIFGPYKQCVGSRFSIYELGGKGTFSPDGLHYARIDPSNPFNLFNFDRCQGNLFNSTLLDPHLPDISGADLFFSPNSRFLYTTLVDTMFQYDLQSNDILASKTLIASWDGFRDVNRNLFDMGLIGRDGKIYVGTPSTNRQLGIIHQPDSLGLACQFEQHALELGAFVGPNMPNFPNYQLGPSADPCDFIPFTASQEIKQTCPNENNGQISLSPVNGQAPFTYQWADTSLNQPGRTDLAVGFYTCSITDASGITLIQQIALHETDSLNINFSITNANSGLSNGQIEALTRGGTPPYSFQWANDSRTDSLLSDLAAGTYTLTITDANGCSKVTEAVVDQLTSSTEIAQLESFRVYPNPSSGRLQLEINLASKEPWQVQIFTADGRHLSTLNGKGPSRKVVNHLPAGVLWIALESMEKRINRRVVILK